MQVMPFWKNELGRHTDDLFNPRINIRYGCAILKHYIKLYSPSLPRALAAYNGSLGRDKYPNKVLKRLAREWPFNPIYSMQPSSVAQSDLQNTLEVNN
ncbi:MAG: lytic transglycosylase domain-containing protein, partial [Arenicella sp.]